MWTLQPKQENNTLMNSHRVSDLNTMTKGQNSNYSSIINSPYIKSQSHLRPHRKESNQIDEIYNNIRD